MTFKEFKDSTASSKPPSGISIPLQGLWYAAKGDWDRAHKIVQDDPSAESAWVHAHLHKQEGDLSNADYWYARAPENTSKLNRAEEWEKIVKALLSLPG